MIEILPKIFFYKLWYNLDFPKLLPMNLTISPSFLCNSRCRTCFAWQKRTPEMRLGEWQKIFQSLGKAPFWVTISGGEPFLRKDLVDLAKSLSEICRPKIISIPTNGLLFEKIPHDVEEILKNCPKTEIIVNLSLDGIGEKHDKVRGVPKNFEKAVKTYRALRKLNYPNFTLGIHTVISKFNVDDLPEIYEYTMEDLKPDQYITEIAEERVELGTVGQEIAPSYEKYEKAIDFLIERVRKERWKKISKITRAFRIEYYNLVKKILKEKRQIIPCYAGFASAQIAPNGDVWPCCIKAKVLGNLKEVDFDFKKIWFSQKADQARAKVKNKKCFCPLANASYTNMLMDFKILLRVGLRYLVNR